MTQRQADYVERIFGFLTELRETTVGNGWSKVSNAMTDKYKLHNRFKNIAIAMKLVEHHPERRGMYRWIKETPVTHRMAHDVWRLEVETNPQTKKNKAAKVQTTKITGRPVNATSVAAEPADIRTFHDAILINDLRRRGYTGTLTPPHPSPITL